MLNDDACKTKCKILLTFNLQDLEEKSKNKCELFSNSIGFKICWSTVIDIWHFKLTFFLNLSNYFVIVRLPRNKNEQLLIIQVNR